MATFLEIQNRVRTNVIDLPTAVSDNVPRLINQSMSFLQRVHNFRVMQAEAQYITNVSANNSHIVGQIPERWKEQRGDPYYVRQQGSTCEMLWQKERFMQYRAWVPFDPNSKGPPRNLLLGEPTNDTIPDPANPDYRMYDLNIEVYPYPDGNSDWTTSPSGEYRIRIPYWGYLPDLVADADRNWFTDYADEFLEYCATARGFQMDWDEQRATYWMTQAVGAKYDGSDERSLGGWARVSINADNSIAAAPARMLVPRRDVFAQRDQWRT